MSSFVATAYGPPWDAMEGTGITSKGVKLKAGQQKLVVAVDPTVIPYGTKLKIWPNPFGDRNLVFTAADTGGAFQGGVNKIDFFVASGRKDQNRWGRRNVSVKIVGRGSPKDVKILGQEMRMKGVSATGNPGKLQMGGVSSDPVARKAALLSYAAQRGAKDGQGGVSLLDLKSQLQAADAVSPSAPTQTFPGSAKSSSGRSSGGARLNAKAQGLSPLKELFYGPQGGWKNQVRIPPIGGHSDHVHVAAGPKTTVRLGKRAQQMGLHVGENPHFGGVAPVHVANSNHYRNEAIDVSGDPRKMAAFTRYLRRLYKLR